MEDDLLNQKDEINKMNEGMFDPTEPPSTAAPSTDPPEVETDAPETSAAVTTSAPATDAPATELPNTKAPATEPPSDLSDDERLQRFREELEASLASKYKTEEKPKKTPSTSAPGTAAPSTTPPFDPNAEVDFLGDQDLEDVIADKASFNALLNRVYKAGVGAGTRLGSEKVLRSIPEIVQKNIQAQLSIQRAREEFYRSNEDLKPYPMVVAESFNTAAAEHPDWTMEKLLKETEKLARQRLQLHRKVMVEASKTTKQRPKFEKPPRGRKGQKKETLTGLAKEIEDMIRLTE